MILCIFFFLFRFNIVLRSECIAATLDHCESQRVCAAILEHRIRLNIVHKQKWLISTAGEMQRKIQHEKHYVYKKLTKKLAMNFQHM